MHRSASGGMNIDQDDSDRKNYSLNFIIMIGWIIAALIGALIFGLLGFTGIARGFAAIAKILFYIFLVVLAIVIIMNLAN